MSNEILDLIFKIDVIGSFLFGIEPSSSLYTSNHHAYQTVSQLFRCRISTHIHYQKHSIVPVNSWAQLWDSGQAHGRKELLSNRSLKERKLGFIPPLFVIKNKLCADTSSMIILSDLNRRCFHDSAQCAGKTFSWKRSATHQPNHFFDKNLTKKTKINVEVKKTNAENS